MTPDKLTCCQGRSFDKILSRLVEWDVHGSCDYTVAQEV